MITNTTIMGLAIGTVGCILLPIIALICWQKKTHAKFIPVLWGALCFIFFTQVLEGGLHFVCIVGDNAVSRAINGSNLLYMLYGAFAAGIFEECGRFILFKTILRSRKESETAISTAIGHGGIESILIAGAGMGLYLALALLINSGNTEAALALTGGQVSFDQLTDLLCDMTITYGLLNILERTCAMAMHICLSVFVFIAANNKARWYYFPLAILLHAVIDMPAALYQRGVIGSLPHLELLLIIEVAVLTFFAIKVYREYRSVQT